MNERADLYRRYADDIFRFALYLTGNRSDAEDITSETFVRVWTSTAPIRTQTVKGYLCTIARNLFLQGTRRTSRHVELVDQIRDDTPGPQERAEHKAELARVMMRLQTLPEVDRAALLMRALEDLPYDEIAAALGISLASVKVKIHRARLALGDARHPSGSDQCT
jgi:RNA polymerase sigma-70 factor (ECF subfamily)